VFKVIRRAYFGRPPAEEVKRGVLISVVTILGLGISWLLAESGYWQLATVLVLVLWVYLIWAGVRFFRRTRDRIEAGSSDNQGPSSLRELGSARQPSGARLREGVIVWPYGPMSTAIALGSPLATSTTSHLKAGRILLASWLAVLAWGELVIVVIVLIAGLVTKRPELSAPFVLVLGLLVSTVALYVVVALPLKCIHCGRRFLFETLGAKSPQARRRGRLDYWATAVIDVILLRRVTCMYCGTEHRVK